MQRWLRSSTVHLQPDRLPSDVPTRIELSAVASDAAQLHAIRESPPVDSINNSQNPACSSVSEGSDTLEFDNENQEKTLVQPAQTIQQYFDDLRDGDLAKIDFNSRLDIMVASGSEGSGITTTEASNLEQWVVEEDSIGQRTGPFDVLQTLPLANGWLPSDGVDKQYLSTPGYEFHVLRRRS